MALYYCKKCGRIAQENYTQDKQICDCCDSIMLPVPKKYLLDGYDIVLKSDDTEQLLIEELVKSSPEFDQYLFDNRDEILSNKSSDLNIKLSHGKAVMEGRDKGNSYGVTCPYCKATNLRKIGIVSRSVSASIFGLGSKKIGKQWHCDHCGSDF
ncbi:MAG: hypothetical protein HDT46_10595 [Ruminococcaceae bacterium]|nr:hypothetical protein [Oscillospiraceae bacterium]